MVLWSAQFGLGKIQLLWPLTLTISTLVVFVTITVAKENLNPVPCHPRYYHWPMCINHPDGYSCKCGPGFYWNTKVCVALGIDSRLVYYRLNPVRYTLMLGKPFPKLESFTIAMWLKVYRPNRNGTIISYKVGDTYNVFRIVSGPSVRLRLFNAEFDTNISLNQTTWCHIAWTWRSIDGQTHFYVDGGAHHVKRQAVWAQREIGGGGEVVLGQSSRTPYTKNMFETHSAFLGEMSQVNIWGRVLSLKEIQAMKKDELFMHCGDAVEWADFRTGTRGAMKLKWPSRIMGAKAPFTEVNASITCDQYCSDLNGAQCKAEVVENVAWERTPANQTASIPCPGFIPQSTQYGNYTPFANRTCVVATSQYDGVWEEPVLDDCVSASELDMKKSIEEMTRRNPVNISQVIEMAESLSNLTAADHYKNPADIATVIDTVSLLVTAQTKAVHNTQNGINGSPQRRYSPGMEQPYLQTGNAQHFAKAIGSVFDHLVLDRNNPGWAATQPPGVEGDELFKVLERLLGLLADCLHSDLVQANTTPQHAAIATSHGHLAFKTAIYTIVDGMDSIEFPLLSEKDELGTEKSAGYVRLPAAAFTDLNTTTLPNYVGVSISKLSAAEVLPNHNVLTKSKENNVNSAIFTVLIHHNDARLNNLTQPIRLYLPYHNDFNVSNPECVRLLHGNRLTRWRWTREGCHVVSSSPRHAVCECYIPGVFAVTTDMYDVNWDKGEIPNILMDYPSYVGCALSALLCLISAVMLVYLRTASKTAAIHKNFAVSIICSQITFMVGIDKFNYVLLCHIMAIMFHYFFLATFSWLMNEAFNLYIVITYAAHSHGDQEGGSQWRYYILGWILPGALVGAFLGTHTDDYYAPDMCWIAWQYIWLFLGPAIGIVSVTILVLIFTAKEQHESSYSKNEATNKMILIHSRALWTQTILLVICWFFAFLTLRMRGVIIKYLYALFNILQGAFFLVFYFLLNDEVRATLLARKKRKSRKGDFDSGSEIHSMESLNSVNDNMIQHDETAGENHQVPCNSNANTRVRRSMNHKPKRKNRSQIEASSDECSDCEIMITSV